MIRADKREEGNKRRSYEEEDRVVSNRSRRRSRERSRDSSALRYGEREFRGEHNILLQRQDKFIKKRSECRVC